MRKLLPYLISAALAVSCVDERENRIARSKEMLRGDSPRYLAIEIVPYPAVRDRFTAPSIKREIRFYDPDGDKRTVEQFVKFYSRDNVVLDVEIDLLRPGSAAVFNEGNPDNRREMTPEEMEELDARYQELVRQYANNFSRLSPY